MKNLDPGSISYTLPVDYGNYAGNDTANRLIAHNLNRIPKVVIIVVTGGVFTQVYGVNVITFPNAGTSLAVTAMDALAFYVGNVGSYINSANAAGSTYYWVAVG